MKKNQINYSALLLPFLLFIISCTETPKPCDLEERNSYEIQKISNIHFKQVDLSVGDKKGLIIRNQEDYEKNIISNEDLPPIDFSKKVLLAGAFKWSQCIDVEEQYFQTGCQKAYYRVEITPLLCMAISTIDFFAVVDKEFVPGNVEFEFIMKESK